MAHLAPPYAVSVAAVVAVIVVARVGLVLALSPLDEQDVLGIAADELADVTT